MTSTEATLMRTEMDLPGVRSIHRGKVRDVYHLADGRTILVATDRISAFDVILPRGIPHKGQVLTQLSWHMLKATAHVAPNWAIALPDPNVVIGYTAKTIPVEMVVRGYLAGHAWRQYKAGERSLCGARMPDGLRENDPFPTPIITPSTKAAEGHDEDITPEGILANGICTPDEWAMLCRTAMALFTEGSRLARMGPYPGRHQIRVRPNQRWPYPADRRDPHTGQFALLPCRWLCRAPAARRPAEAAEQGVRTRMAHRTWLHGSRGSGDAFDG